MKAAAMKTWMLILVMVLALPASVVAQRSDLLEDIEAALSDVYGVREVEVESDGDTLAIRYFTSEIDEVGYRAENLDLYRTVAPLLEDTDFERVRLIPSVEMGDTVQELEQVTVTIADLRAFSEGELTRSEFIQTFELQAGDHQQMPDESQSA
jgi:copper chaperone CopZ